MKNPAANATVERIHATMGNMMQVQIADTEIISDENHDNPVPEMLAACAWGERSMVHSVAQFAPGQLVFSRDMTLKVQTTADWACIKQRRAEAIRRNAARENKRRVNHTCKAGDKVLIIADKRGRKLNLHKGPFKALSHNSASGTLKIRRKKHTEKTNVRRVRPFFEKVN